MIANYHTHTPRCNHAVGSEEEYVQQALKAGIKILGFSDHTPYLFPGLLLYLPDASGGAARIRCDRQRAEGNI